MSTKSLVGWVVLLATLNSLPPATAADGQLGTNLFVTVAQSSDASATNSAVRAFDGVNTTFSLTADLPGSYWTASLGRPYLLKRLELVNRTTPNHKEMAGLTLRLLNLDDQVVYQTNLTNPGSAQTNVLTWPAGLPTRSLWVGLTGSQTNGGGNHRVGLAEVRAYGDLAIPYGPPYWIPMTNNFRVYQSSDYSSAYPAANAVDGDATTFSHTLNYTNSYWMADLGQAYRIDRVELVNRIDCCAVRMTGLILRIFDGNSNSVASTMITNPGAGATWTNLPTAGTLGRYLRVGLENGQQNADGNFYVTLAEVRVYSGTTNLLSSWALPAAVTNLASAQLCYMVRLASSIASPTNANDNSITTETKTTTQTVDGYWETDLGATYALYGLRTIAASGIGYRLTNTIARLFDGDHNSVFAQHLQGGPDVYDTDLNGPVFARFVRVGLEDKQRTDPAGGLEWYIGMREVEVFGRPTNGVGVLSFSTTNDQVAATQPVTLWWTTDGLRHLDLHPGFGSVGTYTATSGVGTVTFPATNSVEYVLIGSNAAGIFPRAVSVNVNAGVLPVRISEFVADNQYSLTDGYGNAPDWIELRNPGNTAVNLGGYGLSDDPAQPMKWVFPSTNLVAHGTLIVFASGDNTLFDPAGGLHANFHLSKAGGALVLTAPSGVTVDAVAAYPPLDTDLAYGRDLEGNWCFLEPTPNAVNAAPTYAGWLSPLAFSQARGFYDLGFTLTLTHSNANATVLYSLDGSIPSIPYTNGLAISGTRSVRAQVIRPGYRSPRVQTSTYVFVNDVITASSMNSAITQDPRYAPRMRPGLLSIPSISVVVPGPLSYDEQEGSIEILWPNGGAPTQDNCGVYYFGDSWVVYPKRSFVVKARSSYGAASLKTPLLNGFDHGIIAQTSFDKLHLRAGNEDMSDRGYYMSGLFVDDSMLDMGDLNPHGRFVHVYLNGAYWGQYDMHEVFMEHMLASYLGGSSSDYVAVKGNDNIGDNFVLGTPDPPNVQPWQLVEALAGSYTAVRPYLDVRGLIDFMLLWLYGDCESEFRACGPLTAGTGFKFWEADADGFLRTAALGMDRSANTGPSGIFGSLVTEGHVDFKTLLADRIYANYFNNGPLTPTQVDARLGARMTEINDSLLAECARWGYQTPSSWLAGAAATRTNLFPARTAQMITQLRARGLYPAFDPPTFTPYGGLVTNGFHPVLASTNGTIYYTLDGSDPRLAGGGLSPLALVWTPGAVTITNDLTITGRVRTAAGQWSALAQPRFLLASRRPPTSRDLIITEINYHPPGVGDCEFIELYNASTNLLDLSGVSLTNAVRYIFPNTTALPPGAFLVVVKDTSAFGLRYQTAASPYYWPGLNVAGPWSGSLDNAGETIQLVASNGVLLAAVAYKPSGDWPTRADGLGSSLELTALPGAGATDAQAQAWEANPSSWAASSLYNGSPGRFDAFTPSLRINELLTHAVGGNDWIELYNSSSQTNSLAGLTLTDDLTRPTRFVFPPGYTLGGGQYLLLTSAQLGFGFSATGESASLLQVAGTNIIRILDSAEFPAADQGETFGLFQRSDGILDLTELSYPTPGTNNALPRVGPVVISELMPTPSPNYAEYLELTSITNGPVPLFDPLRPTNVWTISGIGNYAFPTGTVLAACSTIIVCATNPAQFRAQYGLSPTVAVFGPYSGALAGSGETIELRRPGEPAADGTVPYYRVDHVTYGTAAPWPTGTPGVSIERQPLQAYGNDPAYWRSGPTNGTPGVPAANRPPVIHAVGSLTTSPQAPLAMTLSALDLDVPWQSVSLQATALPPGSHFDPASGAFTWTPAAGQAPGSYHASFVATDSAACNAATTTLAVTVQVAPPLALVVQFQSGATQLSFATVSGESYRVDYRDDLLAGNWLPLQTIVGTGTPASVFDAGAGSGRGRFYRLTWLRGARRCAPHGAPTSSSQASPTRPAAFSAGRPTPKRISSPAEMD